MGLKKKGVWSSTIALLMVMVMIVSGCASGNGNSNAQGNSNKQVENKELQPSQKPKNEAKTKIKVWQHQNVMKDVLTEIINDYNTSNTDGIEVELNIVADKYSDVISLAFTTGDGPDIYSIGGPSLTLKIAENGWGEPLNSYMTDEFKGKFRDGVWVENNNVVDGNVFTLPDTAGTYRMIYNKNLFKDAGLDPEKPPATFAELRDYAKKITEASGGKAAGLGVPMGNGYFLDVLIFNGMGYNALGVNRGFDHKTGKFDFSPYEPLLQVLTDIQQDGSLLNGALLIDGDQGKAKFAQGTIGIMGAASWDPAQFAAMEMNFEMGVADYPSLDGTYRGKPVIQSGSGYGMSASAKDKEKTWKVLEHLYSTEVMGKIIKATGGISLLKEVAENPAYKSDLKYLDQFQIKPTDAIWPPFPPGLKLQGDNMQNVFIQVINGDKKAAEAIEDLNKRYNEAYDKGVKEGSFKSETFTFANFDPLQLK